MCHRNDDNVYEVENYQIMDKTSACATIFKEVAVVSSENIIYGLWN